MSDYRQRSIKRRDERNTKVPVIRAPSGSKRNTKRWCRGKVGREHKPRCVDYSDLKNVTWGSKWKVLLCDECGKQLDHWWPRMFDFETAKTPPAWVVMPETEEPKKV